MRKFVLMVSVAMAALLTMSTAVADPYAPIPKPVCIIKVLKAKPGERVVVVVGARLNAADQPSGTITITLRADVRAAARTTAAGPVWSKTVHTDGKPVRITGPVVPEGTHRITTRFVPDNPTECRQCQGQQVFDASLGGDGGGDDGEGGDNGGLLPDTGGPAMLWLLLGLVLVGSGAGIVVYSRRRAQVPAH